MHLQFFVRHRAVDVALWEVHSRVSLTGGRPRLVKSMGALIIVKS